MAQKKKLLNKTITIKKKKKNKKKNVKLLQSSVEKFKLIENDNVKLQNNIKEMESKIKELEEQLLRNAANFENSKKILYKENEKKIEQDRVRIFTDLIDIVDNFDRAIEHFDAIDDKSKIIDGIKMIDKQFHDYFEKFKIKKFSSKGEKFDPSIHEAISVQSNPDFNDGEIIEEIAKGYKMNDRIIRHAKVIVNQNLKNNDINNND